MPAMSNISKKTIHFLYLISFVIIYTWRDKSFFINKLVAKNTFLWLELVKFNPGQFSKTVNKIFKDVFTFQLTVEVPIQSLFILIRKPYNKRCLIHCIGSNSFVMSKTIIILIHIISVVRKI